jgi:tRNA-uridine 2-sulfurtransferase
MSRTRRKRALTMSEKEKSFQKITKLKGVALLSGGLDSMLAVGISRRLDIEVVGVNYQSAFFSDEYHGRSAAARKTAQFFAIPFSGFDITDEYLGMLEKPAHGYGKNMNPCIDCKIFMFRKAWSFACEIGAEFLITGEVLGERPMSQMMAPLMRIEKKAGLTGRILRPLSGKLLPVTMMEEQGLLRREDLLDFSGRGRHRQMTLARELGIAEYETPAGGCRLTDPIYAIRIRDLMSSGEGFNAPNVRLLEFGRHFKLSQKARLVVGRRESENERIEALAREGDWMFHASDVPGPSGLLRGTPSEEDLMLAASIVLRYSDARDKERWGVQGKRIARSEAGEAESEGAGGRLFDVAPIDDELSAKKRVGQ